MTAILPSVVDEAERPLPRQAFDGLHAARHVFAFKGFVDVLVADPAPAVAGELVTQFLEGGGDVRAALERQIRDLTGPDLRNAILALAVADVAVSNDSGLLHVAAALGTPAVGIFGPTSAWHWAPLNPIAAVVETPDALACRPCHKPVCRLGHHRCMRDISVDRVARAIQQTVAGPLQRTSM